MANEDTQDLFEGLARKRKQKAERSQQVEPTAEAVPAEPPKQKRPRGKRSNPNYEQVGAYIPKELNKQVKRLLFDHEDMDFSDLVIHLLDEWVKQQSD